MLRSATPPLIRRATRNPLPNHPNYPNRLISHKTTFQNQNPQNKDFQCAMLNNRTNRPTDQPIAYDLSPDSSRTGT